MEVINDYGIASKVGYFVMDNASNNDTMIEALSQCRYTFISSILTFLILLIVLKDQYQILYNPHHHRLRCNGHIINLTAQSFLFQTENEALSNENNTNSFVIPTAFEMEQWRQKGPLGKLHNLVVYIQRSTQRITQFRALSDSHNLTRDNST